MAIGIREKPSDEEVDRVVESAVDMFLCRYGAGEYARTSGAA
jgi:hypothetical protein